MMNLSKNVNYEVLPMRSPPKAAKIKNPLSVTEFRQKEYGGYFLPSFKYKYFMTCKNGTVSDDFFIYRFAVRFCFYAYI